MYLININTLELEWCIDAENSPRYAILSHRWTNDEVTFKDFMKGRRKDSLGYRKIQDFCAIVYKDNEKLKNGQRIYRAWVDTCCIDKCSSAELQEAINSMFEYYSKAEICYVHLADVKITPEDGKSRFEEQFIASEWFRRGWTLQELVAPTAVKFCTQDWKRLGKIGMYYDTHGNDYWTSLVSRVSGIGHQFLPQSHGQKNDASIARRMSWAAGRRTTRGEDAAYCLIGLFSVNMPLLYGEGKERAFLRLQEEIMKISDDHSIFAWIQADAQNSKFSTGRGLLADSPSQFSRCQDISPSVPRRWADSDPYTLTSRGMRIVLPLLYWAEDIYLAHLDCTRDEQRRYAPIIVLRKVAKDKQVFQRIFGGSVYTIDREEVAQAAYAALAKPHFWKKQSIYVPQALGTGAMMGWPITSDFFLYDPPLQKDYQLSVLQHGWKIEQHHIPSKDISASPLGYHLGSYRRQTGDLATLLIKHSTNEELFIRVAPMSALFVGFNAFPATSPLARANSVAKLSVNDWEMSRADPMFLIPMYHSQLRRLGTEICVPSVQDSDWCHSVRLDIADIVNDVHRCDYKACMLTLKLEYCRCVGNHGRDANASYVVSSPVGYTADENEDT